MWCLKKKICLLFSSAAEIPYVFEYMMIILEYMNRLITNRICDPDTKLFAHKPFLVACVILQKKC